MEEIIAGMDVNFVLAIIAIVCAVFALFRKSNRGLTKATLDRELVKHRRLVETDLITQRDEIADHLSTYYALKKALAGFAEHDWVEVLVDGRLRQYMTEGDSRAEFLSTSYSDTLGEFESTQTANVARLDNLEADLHKAVTGEWVIQRIADTCLSKDADLVIKANSTRLDELEKAPAPAPPAPTPDADATLNRIDLFQVIEELINLIMRPREKRLRKFQASHGPLISEFTELTVRREAAELALKNRRSEILPEDPTQAEIVKVTKGIINPLKITSTVTAYLSDRTVLREAGLAKVSQAEVILGGIAQTIDEFEQAHNYKQIAEQYDLLVSWVSEIAQLHRRLKKTPQTMGSSAHIKARPDSNPPPPPPLASSGSLYTPGSKTDQIGDADIQEVQDLSEFTEFEDGPPSSSSGKYIPGTITKADSLDALSTDIAALFSEGEDEEPPTSSSSSSGNFTTIGVEAASRDQIAAVNGYLGSKDDPSSQDG